MPSYTLAILLWSLVAAASFAQDPATDPDYRPDAQDPATDPDYRPDVDPEGAVTTSKLQVHVSLLYVCAV
jgi:hypothetical protein